MAFDGIVTRAIVHELDSTMTTGRIMKIYQPTEYELVFTFRSQGKNQSLLLSAHPSYSRFHLTMDNYQNPKTPPMFCMLLRKYLVGGFIEEIEQHQNERIVFFHFRSKNELGDETKKTLVIEVMGKHSNIILIDKEKGHILDSIKHVPSSQNRHRSVMPGQSYVLPPDQGKINPLEIEPEDFTRKLDFNTGKLDKQIVSTYMGLSPLIGQEIIKQASLGSAAAYKESFAYFQSRWLHHDYDPCLFKTKKEDFHIFKPEASETVRDDFTTVSEMLDTFYSGKAERDRVKQQAGDLMRFLKNEREKNVRKIKKHQQTLQKAEQADDYQKNGELLTANMHLLKKGDAEAAVVDYYDPDQQKVSIALNPNKTPSENAQSYFKTYQKLKNSKLMVIKEIEKAHQEIRYLDDLILQIEDAREQDIEEIREELREEGYLKKKPSKKKQKKPSVPAPDTFSASDGTTILVGKNNKQNEYLTNKLASKDDYWLHTKDIPGSHVVIRDRNPSEQTIFEAAQLAALYSKSKFSSSVPVDYTLIRHVKKPNGAKPGFVTYDNQKTIYVTPEEEYAVKLKKQK